MSVWTTDTGCFVTCDTRGCQAVLSAARSDEALLAFGWQVDRAGLEGADTVRHHCPDHKKDLFEVQHVTCGEPDCDHYYIIGDAPTSWKGSYCPDHCKDQETKTKSPHPDAQLLIAEECDAIKAMLLTKNKAYGSSFSDPLRVFSKAEPDEQINVRLDDKLSRLARGSAAGEDVELDLLGYLVLKRVLRKMRGGG